MRVLSCIVWVYSCFRIGKGEARVEPGMLAKAHDVLRTVMLRRLKKEVVELPLLVETRIGCPLTPMQTKVYRRLLQGASDLFVDRGAAGGEGSSARDASSWNRLSCLWMELLKCCNHPYLFDSAEVESADDKTPLDLLVNASGKLQVRMHSLLLTSPCTVDFEEGRAPT